VLKRLRLLRQSVEKGARPECEHRALAALRAMVSLLPVLAMYLRRVLVVLLKAQGRWLPHSPQCINIHDIDWIR